MKYLKDPKNYFCATCGEEVPKVTSVCSAFASYTVGICDECIVEMKEPYGLMVDAIAMVTRDYPNGVNEIYQREVARQLKLHKKNEEEFKEDVKNAAEEFDFIYDATQLASYGEDKFDDFWEDNF